MSKVPAVDQNRYHLSIANLAQFRAKFGIGKFFLFVFGQKTKSQLELRYGPVVYNILVPGSSHDEASISLNFRKLLVMVRCIITGL